MRSGCTTTNRWYLVTRMKLALGTVGIILVAVLGAPLAGCAATTATSAPATAVVPVSTVPVSTTSLTSAALTPATAIAPSSLAAAAWDGDEEGLAVANAAAASTRSAPIAPTP